MNDETSTPRRAPLVPAVPGPGGVPRTQPMGNVAEKKPNGPMVARVPPAPPAPPVIANLAKGIANVMANVGTIQKGGFNRFHQYAYARMEDLLVAITPLMGKNGIVVIQNEVERTVVEGNRMAVTYEFSIIHESGEFWPERPRFTGMSIARDSKGNWDDKCINKCHTAARKYFLLSLFQVPAGDFDEADEGIAQQETQRVPSPTPSPGPGPGPGTKPITEEAKQRASEQATAEGVPHRIILGPGGGVNKWVQLYIKAIGEARNEDEIRQWDKMNDASLQTLSDKYPREYETIGAAVERRLADLAVALKKGGGGEVAGLGDDASAISSAMPDPKQDTQESMNWVAQQLLSMKTYEAAEAFWNQIVAPREQDFDEVDWSLLIREWQRTEQRLGQQQQQDDVMDQQ